MRGFTLIELAVVLAILSAVAGLLAPGARRLRDLSAVVEAREAVVGVLSEARTAAMIAGRAEVEIDADSGLVRASADGVTLRTLRLRTTLGVELDLGGRATSTIRFNALGLGEVSSVSVRLHRAEASRSVVVSSLGRVRRR